MPPEAGAGDTPRTAVSYELRLVETASATGYFAAVPSPEPSFSEALEYLRSHPLDEFMHRHVLRSLCRMDASELKEQLSSAGATDPVLAALLWEAASQNPQLAQGLDLSSIPIPRKGSPLIDLKSESLPDHHLHRQWIRKFAENVHHLAPLPPLEKIGLPLPATEAQPNFGLPEPVTVETLTQTHPMERPAPAPETVSALALERLTAAGILAGEEMRHETSLSPVGLLRQWRFDVPVLCGRHHYRLFGTQTSYGRGFFLETARVRCLMEIVERASSFAGVCNGYVTGTRQPLALMHGSYSRLVKNGQTLFLDPNDLSLEVPYEDAPLYWVQGQKKRIGGEDPVLVPFQCVFLFANLDEIALFSGLGSTGLASGATPQGARKNALLEAIERDCEAVGLFAPSRCFRLWAQDPFISGLLADYSARGIDVFFQDITGFTGVPCYKAFVIDAKGGVTKGTGAHLDGRYALLSALTEIPYPYPNGPPSRQGPRFLPTLSFEHLPNYSSGNEAADLSLLERVLCANGLDPIYVDLTREDLGIPVVRALVPGMEIMADFDRFSRVGPRLLGAYQHLFENRK